MSGYHRRARWDLPHVPASAAEARQAVRAALTGSRFVVDDVVLMVSELVTNACRHARPPVSLQLDIGPEDLRVDVSDGGGPAPTPAEAGPDDTGGRGLAVVEALAETWGVEGEPPGSKSVWFRVRAEADSMYHFLRLSHP